MRKSLGFAVLGLSVSVGYIGYYFTRPVEVAVIEPPKQAVVVSDIVREVVSEVAEQEAPIAISSTVTSAEQTAPTIQVQARTFEEIILDYPNMSGDSFLDSCSAYIKNSFPHRFTPDVIEANVKLVADHFASSCSAVGGKPAYPSTRLLGNLENYGDFWDRFNS